MIGIDNYALFLLTSIILNISPGPDTLYILARTIQQGQRAGILSTIGINAGCLVHTLAVATGLSALLTTSATAFTVIKLLGAVYLIWIGIQSLYCKRLLMKDNIASISDWMIFQQGLITNVLNPKVALFFLALLPQFVNKDVHTGVQPFLLLGFSFIATGFLWSLVLVFIAERLVSKIRQSPRFGQWINRGVGALLIALGLRLAISEATNPDIMYSRLVKSITYPLI
jgi:threonine/homoserine/homoserine lactone efflux protein